MHKDFLARIQGDETKPFFVVKPLNFATRHNLFLIDEAGRKQKSDAPFLICRASPNYFFKCSYLNFTLYRKLRLRGEQPKFSAFRPKASSVFYSPKPEKQAQPPASLR
jgi:hypothetical protein